MKQNKEHAFVVILAVIFILPFLYLLPAIHATIEDTTRAFLPQSCDQLFTMDKIEKNIKEHAEMVEKIQEYHGYLTIGPQNKQCPGKSTLIIFYDTVDHRQKIKELIGDTFFGVPYLMFNE